MTPCLLVLALALQPELTAPYGHRTTAPVRSVNPDADHHRGDGAYGRFDGDLDLSLGAGTTLALSHGDVGLGLRGLGRWYSTLGLYATYAETLTPEPELERRLGFGLELTPLFLVRWSQALEKGPAVLDLALDSLALDAGVSLLTPPDRGFASRAAFELAAGFGVPLAGTAPGPWLEFRAGFGLPHSEATEATALLLFSWHFAVTTPLVSTE